MAGRRSKGLKLTDPLYVFRLANGDAVSLVKHGGYYHLRDEKKLIKVERLTRKRLTKVRPHA